MTNKTLATDILREDHRAIKALFEQYDKVKDPLAQEETIEELIRQFDVHSKIEDELVYPLFSELPSGKVLIENAQRDHKRIEEVIGQLITLCAHEKQYDIQVLALRLAVDSHIRQEEIDLFSKAEKSQLDLYVLGKKIEARRAELTGGAADEHISDLVDSKTQ